MNSHLSEEQISSWIAGEPSPDAERHARECPQCSGEVEQTQRAMLLFRDSGFRCAEYWQKQPQTRTVYAWRRLSIAGAAFAMTVLVAFGVVRWRSHEPPNEQVFLPVPYVVPPAPYERTGIVRMDVPVAALIAAGFRIEKDTATSIPADVLVGQDGRVLAVSPFPHPNLKLDRRNE
jgi:hypothetical protein